MESKGRTNKHGFVLGERESESKSQAWWGDEAVLVERGYANWGVETAAEEWKGGGNRGRMKAGNERVNRGG